jgi:RNA polymerase sigma factor (TIGR02999 family)
VQPAAKILCDKIVPMERDAPADVTALLRAWSAGDEAALERLIPSIDREIRRIARTCLDKEHFECTQTTALVNEAYLHLIDGKRVQWHDRAHFFAVSAQIMRRILVDRARARQSSKRGGGLQPLPLDEALVVCVEAPADLVALHDALTALAAIDPRKGRVVELRFFGGLSLEETAEVLKVSRETVLRDWRLAKAWLLAELSRRGAA